MDERWPHLPPYRVLKGLYLIFQIQKFALNHLRDLEKMMNAQRLLGVQIVHEVDYQSAGFRVSPLPAQINPQLLEPCPFLPNAMLQFVT